MFGKRSHLAPHLDKLTTIMIQSDYAIRGWNLFRFVSIFPSISPAFEFFSIFVTSVRNRKTIFINVAIFTINIATRRKI